MEYYLVLKEWSTDRCYNMDEPWKHNAKWQKPDTNDTYEMYRIDELKRK